MPTSRGPDWAEHCECVKPIGLIGCEKCNGTGWKDPKPVCTVCGHIACPCCGDWCDTVLQDGEGTLCCGGECTYPEEKPNGPD